MQCEVHGLKCSWFTDFQLALLHEVDEACVHVQKRTCVQKTKLSFVVLHCSRKSEAKSALRCEKAVVFRSK